MNTLIKITLLICIALAGIILPATPALSFPGTITVDGDTVLFKSNPREALHALSCKVPQSQWKTPIPIKISLESGYTTSSALSFSIIADFAGDHTLNILVAGSGGASTDTVNYKVVVQRRVPANNLDLVLKRDDKMFVVNMRPRLALVDSGYIYMPKDKYKDLAELWNLLTIVGQQWYKNGELVEGATNTFYYENTPLSGEYNFGFAIREGRSFVTCPFWSKDDTWLVNPTGIAENKLAARVYPTSLPAGGTIQVELNETLPLAEYEQIEASVYNMQGQLERKLQSSSSSFQIDLPFAQGIYLLRLKAGNQTHTTKLHCH